MACSDEFGVEVGDEWNLHMMVNLYDIVGTQTLFCKYVVSRIKYLIIVKDDVNGDLEPNMCLYLVAGKLTLGMRTYDDGGFFGTPTEYWETSTIGGGGLTLARKI